MNQPLHQSAILVCFFGFLNGFLPGYAVADWPDRHGPTMDGHVPVKDAENLPLSWTESDNQSWSTPLHDEGHSSPVIADGRVWLTAASEDGLKQYVIAIDENDGRVLHDKLLFENETVESLGGAVGFNNYAAPTCVLGAGSVFVHFGSYGTAKLDAESASVIWQRRDLECRHYRGPGSSPVLVDGRLILTFDGVDQQYTIALDAKNGETLWRTDRSTDYGDLDETGQPKREGDLRKAYCTPGIAEVDGRKQILSVGSRAMQSYDLATGKELWTVRHGEYNAAIRPLWLPKEGLVILNTGSRGARLITVRLDETTRGDVTDTHVVWSRDKGNPRFAKPVYHHGRLFQCTDNGVLACIDAASGDQIWKGRIRGNYRSSPVLAGENIYFFSEEGRGSVLKAGDKFDELAASEVDEMGTTACPAICDGAIFIRGKTHLFKIAKP